MIDYKKTISDYIGTGAYNYDELTGRLDVLFVEGKLSQADRDELLALAGANAQTARQADYVSIVADHERRIQALETADVPTWVSGYVTNKGETVKFDYDKDGTLDLLRYDGGRQSTSLSPGKIDGWHVVDSTGAILGTYYQGEFTPVSE